MPRPTFFNIAEEKRRRIIAVSLDEFARHPYDLASLSRIIRRTRISKGSLYQYFDDKVELYFWLLDESARRRDAFFQARGIHAETGGSLRDLLAAELAWTATDPRWARVYWRAGERAADPRVEERRRRFLDHRHAMRVAAIRRRQALGGLPPEVDVDLAAHATSGLLGDGLHQAFFSQLDIQPEDLLTGARPPAARVREAAHGATAVAFAIFEGGIAGLGDAGG